MKKVIHYLIGALIIILGIGYFVFTLLTSSDVTNQLEVIIKAMLLSIFSIIFAIVYLYMIQNKKDSIYAYITSIILIIFFSISLVIDANILKLPTQETITDFTSINISEALEWASMNNITVDQVYESSDIVPMYHIINQNVAPGILLKDVSKIEFVISTGPSLDKQLIIPSMIGWNIDEVINYIENNFLSNVNIEYELSGEEKDTVIRQDRSGKVRRNDPIVITLSLGDIDSLEPVELIDFSNMTKFDASIWLKRHGINHEFKYEFSDTVDRHNVISQGITKGTIVNPFDEVVTLTISKGRKIIIPDFTKMSVSEVTEWIMTRNLAVRFSDRYDDTIKLGDIISSNYKPGSEVEEETEIEIVISRGQLKMEEFSSLYNFREWASKYNVKTEEAYEFSNEVPRGNIIGFSYNKGDIIPNDATIKVTISHGKPVTIPNLYGKSWSSIQSTCKSIGLNCSYKYGDYSSAKKDTAVNQSKKSGSIVVSGTSLVVTLSKGPAATFTLILQDSWYSYGSADSSIASLKKELGNRYPGVIFNILKKPHNTVNSGLPHPDSPSKTGKKIKQGETHQIWVVE